MTPATVWGNMLHEVMQSCFASGEWTEDHVSELIGEVVQTGLDRLAQINVGFDEAKVELAQRAQGLSKFSQRYISKDPKVYPCHHP